MKQTTENGTPGVFLDVGNFSSIVMEFLNTT